MSVRVFVCGPVPAGVHCVRERIMCPGRRGASVQTLAGKSHLNPDLHPVCHSLKLVC